MDRDRHPRGSDDKEIRDWHDEARHTYRMLVGLILVTLALLVVSGIAAFVIF